MVAWSEKGFVVCSRPYGEKDLIIEVFTRGHGRYAGLLRAGKTKRYCAAVQPGNLLDVHWNARIDNHLGQFKIDIITAYAGSFIAKITSLQALITACAYLKLLPERENNARLFDVFDNLMELIYQKNQWTANFVYFEYVLLAELGFGISIDKCAVTGKADELYHVSPRTGRAVCKQIAQPFQKRLLKLPPFLRDSQNLNKNPNISCSDVVDGFRLTGYFLRKYIYLPRNLSIPDSRKKLTQIIGNNR